MQPATSIAGISSGLDTTALIEAIMAIERRPIALLQRRQLSKTSEITAWKSVEAMLLAVQTQAASIKRSSTFNSSILATSSDESYLTATAGPNAAFGTYNLAVDQLAQNHQVASAAYADSDESSFGTGNIQISVGNTTSTITIASGQDTLEGIRDAINDAGIDVVASIIDTGADTYSKQLILTSSETGADNTISFTNGLSGGQETLSFTAPGDANASAWIGSSTAGISTPGNYSGSRANTYTFTVGTLADAVIGSPDLSGWTSSNPTMGGTYTGTEDKTYEFQVVNGGTIGTDVIEIVLSDGETAETITLDTDYAGEAISIGSEGVTLAFDTPGVFTADETFSVDLESRFGLVGSDTADVTVAWEDLYGNSGSFDLDAGYTTGDAIDLGDGLQVAFDGGAVDENDVFTIDVSPGSGINTIQQAQDAIVQFGSDSGGGNPIQISSATNQITTLIEGVTIDLHQADAAESIQLTISRDNSGIVDEVQAFVDRYNDLIAFLDAQFSYDPELDQGGVLLGDSSLISLQSAVRSLVTGVQDEVGGDLQTLAQVGIRSGNDGRLSLDQTIFKSKLADDYDAVVALFAELGTATDSDIRFVSSTSDTVSEGTGYRVEVTRAATHAEEEGDTIEVSASNPLAIDVAHKKLRFSVNGVDTGIFNLEEGSYTSGDDLAAMVERSLYSESSLGAQDVEVVWEEDSGDPDQGQLVIRSLRWGTESTIEMNSAPSGANNLLGLDQSGSTSGTNVQGRINGTTATGQGRVLTSTTGDSQGLAIEVLLTAAELSAQGTNQGHVAFTRGMGFRLDELITEYTEKDGLVAGRISSLQTQIDLFANQVEDMEERMVKRERTLTAQFVAMESAMGLLQSQSSFLTAQLSSLQNLNTAIARR